MFYRIQTGFDYFPVDFIKSHILLFDVVFHSSIQNYEA